jgi:type I restriction enzyme S subunit
LSSSIELQDVAKIRSGGTPARGVSSYYGGGIPWAKMSDLDAPDRVVSATEETITASGLDAIRGRLFPAGTLLFAIYGSIGKMAFAGIPLSTNQAILGIEIKDPDRLDSRFLFRWLERQSSKFESDGQGIAQKNLSAAYLRGLKLQLPPLDEQRQIAAILDQADDLRRQRQGALERLRQLPSAILGELFRDGSAATVQRLDQLVRSDDRINYGVVQPGSEVERGIPLIRVENVVDEDFSRPSLKRISPEIEAKYVRSRLRGDEVLVACVGSVGAVALSQSDQRGFNIARAVARIPIDPSKAERVFVAEYLKRPETQAYFRSETRAVAQPTLNIKQLCETRLLVPHLDLQRAFAARVSEIEKLKAYHCAHLAELDALFASLQHRGFRGEL